MIDHEIEQRGDRQPWREAIRSENKRQRRRVDNRGRQKENTEKRDKRQKREERRDRDPQLQALKDRGLQALKIHTPSQDRTGDLQRVRLTS